MTVSAVVFEGKNVDEALETASEKLNIPVDKIDYEVLGYGKTGLLGFIGAKKAKIKIKLEDDNFVNGDTGVSSLVDEAFSSEESSVSSKKKLKKESGFSGKKEKIDLKSVKSEQESVAKEKDESIFVNISEESVEKGREVLEKILPLLVENFEIIPEVYEDKILYNLKSETPGLIIGKKGQNLESIQFIVDKIVNKSAEERARILIDIEGYIERRKENLKRLAERYAEKVKKTGKSATITQLSAYERRFVHITLKEDRRVKTQSVGEGYYRKLVVFPARKGRTKRKNSKRK